MPDPSAAMHQRSGDFDHGNAVDDGKGLVAVALMVLGEVITEQRCADGQACGSLVSGFHLQPLEGDVLPGDAGPQP